MSTAIQIQDLRKVYRSVKRKDGVWAALGSIFHPTYEEFVAVNGISFTIAPGEFVGFLGPNGAGKTTTIKMLTGILYPTSGKIDVLGFEPFQRNPDLLRRIALVMGNRQQLWWDLPANESLKVLKEVYEVNHLVYNERLKELTEALEVADKLGIQVRKLSLGERMKFELVAALLHSPDVIFLDEPTIGLDLTSQKTIREFLRQYNQETGATIVLTSHYMQDIEALCPRVIVINQGKLAFDGGLTDLSKKFGRSKTLHVTLSRPVNEGDLAGLPAVSHADELELTFKGEAEEIARITPQIMSALPVIDLNVQETPIEEVIERAFADTGNGEGNVSRETSLPSEKASIDERVF